MQVSRETRFVVDQALIRAKARYSALERMGVSDTSLIALAQTASRTAPTVPQAAVMYRFQEDPRTGRSVVRIHQHEHDYDNRDVDHFHHYQSRNADHSRRPHMHASALGTEETLRNQREAIVSSVRAEQELGRYHSSVPRDGASKSKAKKKKKVRGLTQSSTLSQFTAHDPSEVIPRVEPGPVRRPHVYAPSVVQAAFEANQQQATRQQQQQYHRDPTTTTTVVGFPPQKKSPQPRKTQLQISPQRSHVALNPRIDLEDARMRQQLVDAAMREHLYVVAPPPDAANNAPSSFSFHVSALSEVPPATAHAPSPSGQPARHDYEIAPQAAQQHNNDVEETITSDEESEDDEPDPSPNAPPTVHPQTATHSAANGSSEKSANTVARKTPLGYVRITPLSQAISSALVANAPSSNTRASSARPAPRRSEPQPAAPTAEIPSQVHIRSAERTTEDSPSRPADSNGSGFLVRDHHHQGQQQQSTIVAQVHPLRSQDRADGGEGGALEIAQTAGQAFSVLGLAQLRDRNLTKEERNQLFATATSAFGRVTQQHRRGLRSPMAQECPNVCLPNNFRYVPRLETIDQVMSSVGELRANMDSLLGNRSGGSPNRDMFRVRLGASGAEAHRMIRHASAKRRTQAAHVEEREKRNALITVSPKRRSHSAR